MIMKLPGTGQEPIFCRSLIVVGQLCGLLLNQSSPIHSFVDATFWGAARIGG